ncbi:FAD-dependent monooxygenase [Streptomyces albus]|uniref:FAD-dependent monooxygenase n=1 Tax=Streptomyces albus TaxID=1888 RepID=UPI00068AFB91|nr:FAD-dependent monooxygenase [Streptomyces albus]
MNGRPLRRVAVVGAGAAGAFFTLELARLRPDVTIDLYDRDGRGPGAGIVMSTDYTDHVRQLFPSAFDLPETARGRWDRTLTLCGGERIWSGAYGMVGLRRRTFHSHVRRLAENTPGVRGLRRTVTAVPEGPEAPDVVVLADGAGSRLRRSRQEAFGTTVTAGRTRFLWAAAPAALEPSFVLKDLRPGLLIVHSYPHAADESTFIVEADPAVLAAHGLDGRPLPEIEKELAAIFTDELRGVPLHAQTTGWQPFRTVVNERWHDGRCVLVGDAAHTVHFSTGSGTALAIDDALCLAGALAGGTTVPEALDAYAATRQPVIGAAQEEAGESAEWFETLCRGGRTDGHRTVFALRSRRPMNTYDRLRDRDPRFVARTVSRLAGHPTGAEPRDVPLTIGGLTLESRVAETEGPGGRPAGLVLRTAGGGVRCPVTDSAADPRALRAAGARAVGLLVPAVSGPQEPAAGAAATLADDAAARGFDFLAVPSQPGAGRIARTRRAEELTSAGVLPVVLLPADLPAADLSAADLSVDEINTLIAAGRADMVARPPAHPPGTRARHEPA